jgi:tight adherence protein C
MILLLIIGIILTGLAVAILARVSNWDRSPRRSPGILRRIQPYSFTRREQTENTPAGVRGRVDQVATKLGSMVGGRSDSGSLEGIRRDLIAAGYYEVKPGRFLGYQLLCAIGVPLLWIWLGVSTGVKPIQIALLTAILAFLGWWLPRRILQERAKQRLSEIDYQLPELIDLLVVTIEAGLGFVGSLQTAAGRLSDPLGREIRLTLQEQSMGLSIQEAMLNMLGRCDTPSMRSFVRSIVQGETLGVSIGQIMRDLAHEMRRRRHAAAQERAQKAPIKILFPLVLFIFPPMFVVLLAPALFRFTEALGSFG